MAKAQKSGSMKVAVWLIVIVFCALAAVFYTFREPIGGYAEVGTSYAARVACSCRFVSGRSLDDCEKDKLGGMELVTLVDDVDAKSVTARFPLVTANTATYREGFGCVLEKWER
ncbi:hypothetical protein [Erythrobacter sp. YT30]|uniref:hypothetical protein n=1 Tax=Erythrobacter sp. YT30 TaxID=1735012 RepID=UPI0012E3AEB5|nr:hypothetical protein [Erythrobacter sp. YT30]